MEILQRNDTSEFNDSQPLVDRMDSAIGEASTSIGMIMSELVRRSLRGGVGEIGSSIHMYARDQVDEAVGEAMPRIESAVEKIAESTSTRITDVAVNRIGEELKIVESRTTEQTQVIAARIKADSEAAFETVHRVIGESRENTEKTAQELRDLQSRAKDSWKKVQLELTHVNEARARLERQLQDTEERLARSNQQLTETIQRLDEARREHSETRQHMESTAAQLAETRQALIRSQQELGQTRTDLVEATQGLSETQHTLLALKRTTQQNAASFESLCSSMAKRLEELERPKGIRALFSRFKGGKKGADSTDDSESAE